MNYPTCITCLKILHFRTSENHQRLIRSRTVLISLMIISENADFPHDTYRLLICRKRERHEKVRFHGYSSFAIEHTGEHRGETSTLEYSPARKTRASREPQVRDLDNF